MSFNITKMGEQKFRAKVNYKYTAEDGKIQTATFTAIFKKPSQPRWQEIIELSRSAKDDEEKRAEVDPIPLVLEHLTGWSEIEDENGAVPFTTDVAEALMNENVGMTNAFFDAFWHGVVAAPRKN